MQSIHFDVGDNAFESKYPILVRKEFLHNMESGHGEFLPIRLFAISSYPGHVPTFQGFVEDRYIFSYLPIHALAWKEVAPLTFEESNYFNCPSGKIVVHSFLSIQYRPCQVFNKGGSYLDDGLVAATVEWYEDNELCHLVQLRDGNLVWRPSHKLIFGYQKEDGIQKLPSYKKLRHEWILNK